MGHMVSIMRRERARSHISPVPVTVGYAGIGITTFRAMRAVLAQVAIPWEGTYSQFFGCV